MICTEPGVLPPSEYYIFQGLELDQATHPYMAICGSYKCCFGYSVKRQFYDHLLISYILKGTFHLKYKGQEYEAGPGQVVIIDCRNPHHFWAGKTMDFIWIHFNGGNTHAICKDLNHRFGPIIEHRNCAYIHDRLSELVSRFKNNLKISAPYIASLILDLMYRVYPEDMDLTISDQSLHPSVKSVIEYMKYRIGSPLNIEAMAEIANLSRYHFSRLFKEETGFSPYEYLLELRMDMARHLLSTTDQPVGEIAYSLGYNSAMGFSMAFSKREGLPPGAFRKQRKR